MFDDFVEIPTDEIDVISTVGCIATLRTVVVRCL